MKPGEQASIELVVPTAGLAGDIRKSVDVYTDASHVSILNFEVRAHVTALSGTDEKGAVCR